MKHLPGADPELVLLGQRSEELEVRPWKEEGAGRRQGVGRKAGRCADPVPPLQRIPLSEMTREEINALVQELGFYRKAAPDDPVPPEYLQAPAKPAKGSPDRADL